MNQAVNFDLDLDQPAALDETQKYALEQTDFVDVLLERYERNKQNLISSYEAFQAISATNMAIMHCFGTKFTSLGKMMHLLNVQFWGDVYRRSNIELFLDSEKRKEWSNNLRLEEKNTAELPEFNRENILATLKTWYEDRESLFADRVDLVFRSLSRTHVTNQPEGFSKKMVFSWACEPAFGKKAMDIRYDYREIIFDLAALISSVLNQPTPSMHIKTGFNNLALGERHPFLGGAFELQVFKNGNMHIWIEPALAIDLNIWLAKKYPSAIPTAHRTKAPQMKEFVYSYDHLTEGDASFLGALAQCNYPYSGRDYESAVARFAKFTGLPIKEAKQLGRNNSQFAFVARQLLRTGYPNIKDHQFFATPEEIVECIADYLGSRVESEMPVLEPSAGTGMLARIFPNKDQVQCVEVSPIFSEVLKAHGFSDVQNVDFMRYKTDVKYPLIVMNPPYAKKQLENHLTKALSHLSEDGELILVAPRGKLRTIEELAAGRTVTVISSHSKAFADTSIETSIFSIQ